jgi:hypothetical protein
MRKLIATGAIALGLATLPISPAHAGTTWIVGIKASATTVNAGQKVVFTGTVRPRGAAAGEKVLLQEKFKPGKPWVTQRKAKINGKGRYSATDRPTTNTTHAYRVVMPATNKHAKGVSKTVKVTVYAWSHLVELDSTNARGVLFGSVDINGNTYKHSVYSRWSGGEASVEFNLDHQCDKLRSTFGISDESTTGGQAEVGVLSDGTSVYDKTFDVGQSQNKTVALATPLKIKLVATDTSTAPGTAGYGAFGNAQAHCTQ